MEKHPEFVELHSEYTPLASDQICCDTNIWMPLDEDGKKTSFSFVPAYI